MGLWIPGPEQLCWPANRRKNPPAPLQETAPANATKEPTPKRTRRTTKKAD